MTQRPTASEPTLEPIEVRSAGGVSLEGHLVRAPSVGRRKSNAVVFFHGFPSADVSSTDTGRDMPELCQRICADFGWDAMTVRFRGCGQSGGEFSLARWVDDAASAIRFLKAEIQPDTLWVCGFGTGGSVGLVAAADSADVTGGVVVGAPADFDDWAADPEQLLAHARKAGVISSTRFPPDRQRWDAELKEVRAVEAAERFKDRPLLVLHGSEDEAVPHFDARVVADAHGSAELRFVPGGGHQLRHDPRAVSVLLAWLDRTALSMSGQPPDPLV